MQENCPQPIIHGHTNQNIFLVIRKVVVRIIFIESAENLVGRKAEVDIATLTSELVETGRGGSGKVIQIDQESVVSKRASFGAILAACDELVYLYC